MRTIVASAGLVALALSVAPAVALDSSAPMSSWKRASDSDRSELLDRLVGSKVGAAAKAAVRHCLDEAAMVPGHGDLPISEIAGACGMAGTIGQPV